MFHSCTDWETSAALFQVATLQLRLLMLASNQTRLDLAKPPESFLLCRVISPHMKETQSTQSLSGPALLSKVWPKSSC